MSEPAIQVRRKGQGKQIWALEKMENRVVDMRELYQEWKDFDEDNSVSEEKKIYTKSEITERPLHQSHRTVTLSAGDEGLLQTC